MAYESLNFSSYENMRPETEDRHEVDDTTLKSVIYAECRPVFDGIAKVVGQYTASHQDQKLRLFFEMMETALNDTIDLLAEQYGKGGHDAGNG